MPKPRILFVDDDARELEQLRKQLAPIQARWDVQYAHNGAEALKMIRQNPCHVLISDLQMPGMDGVKLLTEVVRCSPMTIRFLWTNPVERKRVFHSIGVAHQVLTKPSSLHEITSSVSRALRLHTRLQAAPLRQTVARIGVLPSMPLVYMRLVQAMENPEISLNEIGAIIEQDLGMSAKVLQLMNSPLYGLRNHIGSITQAVSLLGVDIIKNLLIWFHIGSKFGAFRLPGLELETVQRHSLLCGRYAQTIAAHLGFDKLDCDTLFVSGMFHDLGILVLASSDQKLYHRALTTPEAAQQGLAGGEYAVYGTSHAEVGAYLLALWGFHDQIVETCCYHHNPQWQTTPALDPVAVLYLANLFAHQETPAFDGSLKPLTPYLSAVGLESRMGELAAVCKETVQE